MVSSGQISSRKILDILERCAPSHATKDTTHKRFVYFDGKVAVLPLGPHGRRKKYDLELGHVKKLIRLFDIGDCVREHFPGENIV
jgi:hypothetical protein